jgi:enterochelin esterase family protein
MRFLTCLILLSGCLVVLALRARAAPSGWEDFRSRCCRAGAGGDALVGSFLNQHTGPLIEEDKVVFLYWDRNASRVEIGGDFTGWSRWEPAHRLAQSSLFYVELRALPASARVEYRFRVDGREVVDPRNPHRVDNGVGGENSVLAMPEYRPVLPSAAPLRGRLRAHDLPLPGGGARRVVVYTPPGNQEGPWPSLYIHDGSEYLQRTGLARVAEDLVAQGRMDPAVLVFIDPLDRFREYDRDPGFTREMVESIVPFVDGRYPTRRDPAWRGVMGASMGGLISWHLGVTHPEVFGRVASQSGAFAHRPEVRQEVGPSFPRRTRLYLDVGLYDLVHPDQPSFLQASRQLAATLREQGFDPLYREFPAGHSWTAWRDQLPVLLEFMFPVQPDSSRQGPEEQAPIEPSDSVKD